MTDLNRLPHRLGDSSPRRIDQVAGGRAPDKGPRQAEHQGRVLVAARIKTPQRHQQFAAAHIGIADQVERRIGRDESVAAERAQQMCPAGADHRLDLVEAGRALR